MEEADVLCNRIGIVNHGVLVCLGSQARLKQRYGGGYHLFVNCTKSKQSGQAGTEEKVIVFLKKLLPRALLLRNFNSQLVYQVPVEGFSAAEVFGAMESNKANLGITDWGISQCSLEDVFTRICELI